VSPEETLERLNAIWTLRPSPVIAWYRKAAEHGDADAQHKPGIVYRDGRGAEKDDGKALHWLRKSAGQGHAEAWRDLLAMCYKVKNYADAVRWHRQAAEQGDPYAQADLGYMYRLGLGLEKNYAEAARWNREAARRGNAVAQSNLGLQYRYALGVPQDFPRKIGPHTPTVSTTSLPRRSPKNRRCKQIFHPSRWPPRSGGVAVHPLVRLA
jgi:TPR repeat protein